MRIMAAHAYESVTGVTSVPAPYNEPVLSYAPGTPERSALITELTALSAVRHDLTATIGGVRRPGGGAPIDVVQPHNHQAVLGTLHNATQDDARAAVAAARDAAPAWRALSFDDRAAILLKAADLLSGPWRATLNAATMLGQSKTAVQAEIDSACELIDFWRFNAEFARQILAEQPPENSHGIWNRTDHRPLDGFVYAITPFNFTAIAGNLPTAPVLMGNTVIWKPSPTQQLAAHFTLRLLEAAGLPPGVINMLPGDGLAVSEVVMASRDLAGIHFTGSTATFQHLWRTVGENIAAYRAYPRIVGETGGKDFVLAHPSADKAVLKTALTRGAFEYQGQKCSAASRAYIPRSLWTGAGLREEFSAEVDGLSMGDPAELANFMGAVIDARAFAKHRRVLDVAHTDDSIRIAAGGTADDSIGYFVRPTVMVCSNPEHAIFSTEYFGPLLSVYVYEDSDYDRVLRGVEGVTDYALTGSIIAQDRAAVAEAMSVLRFAAGNFYINDKPTGAVVGQQPFGGSKSSGTNDKAGSAQNLMRWTSTRLIKETFVPPTEYRYPHMD
ncbi:delta-1-pyrroline-5-carboxylate dehydrogenase [Catenulispora acidiphila DSM 44928]|uniref:L-glutamate gamma-semialdehyde dehydrogenase n=2 Tax=Catenulispora TaxID=414878 RepID=C7QBB2_CATAD|nr:delta-1-pyrroline-5-carboxylate dehydrogenase [Catenulispora acidiphila DSM 44928]